MRRRRVAAGVLDSGATSGTNFLVAIFVASSSTVDEFGRFAAMFAIMLVVMGLARAATTEPLMVLRGELDKEIPSRRVDGAVVTLAVVLALIVSVGVLVPAFLIGGDVQPIQAAVIIGIPVIVAQDAVRFIALSHGRPQVAALQSGGGLVGFAAGAAVLRFLGNPGGGTGVVLAWMCSAVVVTATSVVVRKIRLECNLARWWLVRHRRFVAGYASEAAVSIGVSQGVTAGLVFLSPEISAAWRGATTLLGPFTTVLLAANALVLPAMVRRRNDKEAMVRLAAGVSLSLGGLACAWALLLAALPTGLGVRLLGDSWYASRDMFGQASFWIAGTSLAVGAQSAIRSLRLVGLGVMLRCCSGAILLGGLGAAFSFHSPPLVLWAFGVSTASVAVVAWGILLWQCRSP